MRNRIFNILIFAAGAAVGSAVTWKLLKTKYEQIAQEEIDSVKEVFSRRENDVTIGIKPSSDSKPIVKEKPDLAEYAKMLKELKYTSDEVENEEKGGNDTADGPYVISPDEFGEIDDYETVSLSYYEDGVLADDWDNEIEDVESLVGEESLSHFGEYEEDCVYVRNDRYKTDYEILMVLSKYSDVKHTPSYQIEE